jgi:amino acid transporter
MITLSALSPGLGVFVVGGDVLREAGGGAILAFIAAALLGVAMASVYSELISAFPDTGAEYTLLGRTVGPSGGFAALGLILMGAPSGSAITSLGVASYLKVAFPGLPLVPCALTLTAIAYLIAVLNIRLSAFVTGVFLTLEILSLVVLGALGLAHPHRGIATLLHPALPLPHGGLAPVSLAVMGTAFAGAVYAFNGYSGVVSVSEEIHDPHARVTGVVFGALGLACLLEILPMAGVWLGARDLPAMLTATSPVAAFAREAGGPLLAYAMGLSVAVALFNCNIANSLMFGRQLYSTGRDGVWSEPVNRALATIHPRLHSPWVATLVMGGLSMIACLVPLHLLVLLIGSGTSMIYVAVCLGVIAGRRNGATNHSLHRTPLYPLAPAIALIALTFLLVESLGDPEGRIGVIAALVIMAVSVALYRLYLRRRGRWAHRGPDAERESAGALERDLA